MILKTLIVYYSYEGNSALVAAELGKLLNADLLRIEIKDEKARKGFSKFVWGGKMVFSKKLPELKPYNIDINQYDLIVLGAPVWAGSPVPAILKFLKQTPVNGKKTAFFLCHAGGKGKADEKLSAALSENTIAGKIDFINPGSADRNTLIESLKSWAAAISG